MSSTDIRTYFLGIDYPAHREDLVRIIRHAGASDDDVRIVRDLPDRNFTGLFDLCGAIRQAQGAAGTEVA